MMIRLSYILFLFGSCIILGIVKGYNFGFNNSYTCHCLNDIPCNDQTGACNNGCTGQWLGPSCQRENIAYNKTANQSGQEGNQGPWFAVDGDRRNDNFPYCIDTGYSPWAWWFVDLGQLFTLNYFTIFYRSSRVSYLKGFSVHIDNELCYQHPGTSNPPDIFSIECSRTITGRYVNISNNRPNDTRHYISLCEVEIYVCSRGTYGPDCNNFCHCSNYDKCDVITGQCPNGCQIGWYGDSCSRECEDSYGQDCRKRCTDRKCSGILTCDHVTGQCVNGCTPGYLIIDCTQECEDSYGQDCSKRCTDRKCSGISTCDHVTGQCVNGCTTGYLGIDCTQECQGSYGENCSKQCSDRNCLDQSSCNNIDGKCIGGCKAGYRSLDCTQLSTIESKLSNVETGIIGTVIGISVGFLIGVGVERYWVTRKQKAQVPEAYYEDIPINSGQITRDNTNVNHQTTIASQQIQPQDTVSTSPASSNMIGESGNKLSAENQQISSDTGNDYYNIENNTYEELDDSTKQNDNTNDYQSL